MDKTLQKSSMAVKIDVIPKKNIFWSKLLLNIRKNYGLYLLSLPTFVFYIIFAYLPMYGVQIAFKEFIGVKGIIGSPWVGLDNIMRFVNSFQFWDVLKNTLGISIYSLAIGFPLPIILAIMLDNVNRKYFKKTVQMVTYAPNFISTVVLVGMMDILLASPNGPVNQIIVRLFNKEAIDFFAKPAYFKTMYVFSGVWQNTGWSSIIYIAALAGIDPQLHEAAKIDGANKLQRIWYIDIPGIIPTAVILLILNAGQIMSVGFEKIYLMQNPLNMNTSEVISTYVYRVGMIGNDYSFSAAVGLFNSLINFCLLVMVNKFAKKISEVSLW